MAVRRADVSAYKGLAARAFGGSYTDKGKLITLPAPATYPSSLHFNNF